MRRHRRRHAHRDALRAIGEQVRQRGRQHDRLLLVARIIVAEIDGILVDAFEQQPRDIGHARFGVAIGGSRVAIDIAEIALPVDQRIARGEILREAHQRIVDRLVAVRMERAHHVADDLRAFLEGRAGIEPQNLHAVENAAMDGFEPVAGVRQRASHDGRQRIGEIALFQRLAQIDGLRFGQLRRIDRSCHVLCLSASASRGKRMTFVTEFTMTFDPVAFARTVAFLHLFRGATIR